MIDNNPLDNYDTQPDNKPFRRLIIGYVMMLILLGLCVFVYLLTH